MKRRFVILTLGFFFLVGLLFGVELDRVQASALETSDKVSVCQVPDGNPDAAHPIWVDRHSLKSHLKKHPGDFVIDGSNPCPPKPTVTPTTPVPTTPVPTTETPTVEPTTETPTVEPTTETPTVEPTTETPTVEPTTETPTEEPSKTVTPTEEPTEEPTVTATTPVPPTDTPTEEPSKTVTPTEELTEEPTAEPTEPTAEPSKTPPVVLPVAPRCNFVFADLSEEQKAECDRSSGGIYIPDVLPKPGDEFAVDVSGSQNDCAHYWELTRSADGTYHRGTYTWVKDRWEPPKGYETGLWRTQFFGKPVTAMWSVQDPISLVWTEMWHEAVPFGDIYMIDNIPRERIIFVFDGLWGNGPFSWDEVAEKKIQPAGNYEPFTRFYGSSNRWSINPDLK